MRRIVTRILKPAADLDIVLVQEGVEAELPLAGNRNSPQRCQNLSKFPHEKQKVELFPNI